MAPAIPESSEHLARALSRLFGWIYTLAWSASFWPQPWLNFQRKSVKGVTIDFPILNVLGFVCYTISTACFLYSPVIRKQYAARHPVSPEPTVRFNDLAFGVHAVVLVVLTYSQFYPRLWGFEVSASHHMSRPVAGIFWGSILACLLVIFIVMVTGTGGDGEPLGWAYIDILYTFGYVKLLVTFVKYIPQVILNRQRQSTKGWSIWQILFDFIGGILSLMQLVIDSALQSDWSGLLGNPVKLGLAGVSVCFDLIFITQHYYLYTDRTDSADKILEDHRDDAIQPLLENDR